MRIRGFWAAMILGVPLAFMAAFFVAPFAMVLVESLRNQQGDWTLANYLRIVSDAYYPTVMLTTFKLSALATLTALLIGYPIAYYLTEVVKSRWVRRLGYLIVIMPLFTSNIVRSFGWLVLLGRRGLVNDVAVGTGLLERPASLLFNEGAVVVGLTYILVPFVVLSVAAVLQTIDRSLVEASSDLGTSRLSTFVHVTFPLSLPGVIAGSLMVFTLSVSAYVVPAIMSGGRVPVIAMSIFEQYGSVFDFNFGAALSVSLLLTTLLILGLYGLFVERHASAGVRKP